MTLDQLIKRLEELRQKYGGEIEVKIYDDYYCAPIGIISFNDELEIDGSHMLDDDTGEPLAPSLVIQSTAGMYSNEEA